MTTLKDAPENRTIETYTQAIDDYAVDGLSGVEDSLAYKVAEIEKHIHNREFWLGEHETRSLEDDCGQINTMAPFQTDAGDGSVDDYTVGWGSPLCVIGRNDLPVTSDGVKFDLHRIVVVDVQSTADLKLHKVQIIYGRGTFAEAVAAGQITELAPFIPLRGGAFTVMDLMMPRCLCGADKVWVRHWVDGIDTGTMDFFVGIHEYPQFTTAIPTTTTTSSSSTSSTCSTISTTSSSSSTASTISTTSSSSSTASTSSTSSTCSTISTTSSTSSTASTSSTISTTSSSSSTSSTQSSTSTTSTTN